MIAFTSSLNSNDSAGALLDGAAPALHVRVKPPEIIGDTVTFKWTQSRENPFQRNNEFYFRYEGLRLDHFTSELLFEIFIALQTRVFGGYDTRVEIELPSPVSRLSAAFWLAFNRASNVSICPLAESTVYDPWKRRPTNRKESKRAAVYFGGGKDSTLLACLLAEIYGADQVLLIQFIGPLRESRSLELLMEERQDVLMLAPARERLGFATQRIWTNYQANFRKAGYHLRPNMELYSVGSLPALLSRNISLSSVSASWLAFRTTYDHDGIARHRYANVRPETLAAQSSHYRSALGFEHTVANLSLPFNGLVAYWLLAERYPAALRQIVMCTVSDPDRRWCYQCKKCSMFALLGLSTAVTDPDFNYDFWLRQSRFISQVKEFAGTMPESKEFGNAPWMPFFFDRLSFVMYCHIVARIEIDDLHVVLSDEAIRNLGILKSLYGNRPFPEYEAVSNVLLDRLGHELGPRLKAIASEHLEIIGGIPEPAMAADGPAMYLFDQQVSLPIDEVEHVKQ